MKIARITAHPVCYPEPNDANALRYLLFVRIESDDGIVGWGEAITQFAGSTWATIPIVKELAGMLVGRSPLSNRELWHDMCRVADREGRRCGVAQFAISAIDVALWDLKGKLLGQPVLHMIGSGKGGAKDRIPAVAATKAFPSDLDVEVRRIAQYVRSDFFGVKVGMVGVGRVPLGRDVRRDIAFVTDLRSAMGHSGWISLVRGAGLTWTFDETVRRVVAWQEEGIKWVQDPFEPWELDHYRRMRRSITCLVAGGEREWDRRGYAEIVGSGVLDVINCDVGRAGGITGAQQVIRIVEAAGLSFNTHAWSSAISTAASIALSLSTSCCLLQEMKPYENPMQHELVREPLSPSGGYITCPKGPGLGVDVNESVLRKYALK